MPLPTIGPLSLSQVNTELGRASNATISLGEAAVRALAGVASGPISKASLRGKANAFGHIITANQLHLNLRTYLLGQGWNGTTAVQVTIAPGVYIWSDNTSVPALDMGGAFPGGLTVINNGFIMGKGGKGGDMNGASVTYSSGAEGGPAIALTGPITINNTNGYIGGGGAGFINLNLSSGFGAGGGGAGGGQGGTHTESSFVAAAPAPPPVGQVGSQTTVIEPNYGALYQYPATHGGAGGGSSVRRRMIWNIRGDFGAGVIGSSGSCYAA